MYYSYFRCYPYDLFRHLYSLLLYLSPSPSVIKDPHSFHISLLDHLFTAFPLSMATQTLPQLTDGPPLLSLFL